MIQGVVLPEAEKCNVSNVSGAHHVKHLACFMQLLRLAHARQASWRVFSLAMLFVMFVQDSEP